MNSRMQGVTIKALALALTTFVISAAAAGQGSSARRTTAPGARALPNERTKGIMLGVHTIAASGVTLAGGAFEAPYGTNFGAGAGFMIGYGINRTFSAYVSSDVAKQRAKSTEGVEGSFGLGHVEIGARANLALGLPSTVPYISASVGRRGLGARATDEDGTEADIAFHGRMLGLGAGIEHFFSPTMSFDGGVQLGFGKFDHLTVAGHKLDLPVDGTTSMRLRLGVTWRPRN